MGDRHYLHPDVARLALFGSGLGSAFARGGGLVYEAYDCQGAGVGCLDDGGVAP